MANQPGDFIWYELLTTDADAAAAFYRSLLGWDVIDASVNSVEDYRIFMKPNPNGGEPTPIAGMLQITSEMQKEGARPVWLGYLCVNEVDNKIDELNAAGCSLMMPAKDIPDVGRIALLQDPQGAPFYIMQPASGEPCLSFNADKNAIGHCAWNELATGDTEAAIEFYNAQFGFKKIDVMDMGENGQYIFLGNQQGRLGATFTKPEQMPAMWTYYFRVADIAEAAQQLEDLGAKIMHGPHQVPEGDYIILGEDPLGCLFALVGAKR